MFECTNQPSEFDTLVLLVLESHDRGVVLMYHETVGRYKNPVVRLTKLKLQN